MKEIRQNGGDRRARLATPAEGKSRKEGQRASTRLFLTVVTLAVFTTVLTDTITNGVIPLMRAEFGASAAHVGWVITGSALAYAVGIPLYGGISDFFGVRPGPGSGVRLRPGGERSRAGDGP